MKHFRIKRENQIFRTGELLAEIRTILKPIVADLDNANVVSTLHRTFLEAIPRKFFLFLERML